MTRREAIRMCAAIGASATLGAMAGDAEAGGAGRAARRYHLSISEDALDADPDLLRVVREAGVTDIWVTGFLYGYWHYTPERIAMWRQRAEAAGLAAHVINVPLGHPGDSLGAMAGDVPLSPPKTWRLGMGPSGEQYSGTSLHAPATDENAAAIRRLAGIGVRQVFVDDDFRLARSPGMIGGCFCDDHRREFLAKHGYPESAWAELLDAVGRRTLTPVLRAWIEWTCDQLTACFRAQQAAALRLRLGNMVMFMGAEKAGIRLADYRNALFRVGEGMFDDGSFGRLKGKTDELFSALFHRRYARPDLAYSETTAYPATALSARNMAGKLAVSTIADVRNTMYMSGLTAFPREHWSVLGPAMRRHAAIHAKLAGHQPSGPLHHWWGERGRMVSDDAPYSLFLACGVPFDVVDGPGKPGWTFAGDHDAASLRESGKRSGSGTVIARSGEDSRCGLRAVPETLEALFALRREIRPQLGDAPVVVDEVPAVLAWYPTAHAALLWNVNPERKTFAVERGGIRRSVTVDPLDVALLEGM